MNLLSKFLSKYSREHIIVAKILHTLFLTAPESVLLFLLFFFSHHKSILYLAPINYLGGILLLQTCNSSFYHFYSLINNSNGQYTFEIIFFTVIIPSVSSICILSLGLEFYWEFTLSRE